MSLLSIRSRWARCALGAALLAAALSMSGSAGAGTAGSRCPGADTPAAGADASQINPAVVCLVNGQRAIRGLPDLQEDRRLDRSAQGWTDVMVASGSFTHGPDFSARITAAGFSWADAGENIATGFRTPREVMDAWMASPGHCRNILDPVYSRIGVGFVTRPVAGSASSGATWTQDFGLPAGARPPSQNAAPMDGCPYRSSS
jgi:uncharacterized protein YkwD